MHEDNKALIQRFYQAFADHDAEAMAACYADNVVFEDPAFGVLEGKRAGNMWRMLVERGKPGLKVTFSDVQADAQGGSARWEAHYAFGPKKRPVHNVITAQFKIADGKIVDHRDSFDFWKWSRMALGMPGVFLGWTGMLRNKVGQTARGNLAKYEAKNQR